MKKILFFALALALSACQKTNDKNPALIGKWQGNEWLIEDKDSGIEASSVGFEFDEDGTYSANFADQVQKGTWRTEKDKLYTTQTGQKEIMVKMLKFDGAALDFEMNRSGRKETLKMTKKVE
jgi:hypothetical protein